MVAALEFVYERAPGDSPGFVDPQFSSADCDRYVGVVSSGGVPSDDSSRTSSSLIESQCLPRPRECRTVASSPSNHNRDHWYSLLFDEET